MAGYAEYAFVADLYDHVELYRDRPDIAFFVETASSAGSPVLEAGCGTGRVLVPTARAGVDIVGLDLSPHMLYADYDRSEYGSKYPGELVCVARKVGA